MTRTAADRIADVRRLLHAAERVAKDPNMAARLVQSSGLSREGVLLGLTRYLEVNATDLDIAKLVQRAGDASRVHVILSPSVFVAPLRAIAIALATAPIVTVKASRREPWFAVALVRALENPNVTISIAGTPADVAEGEIHVYGRDQTISDVRAAARPDVKVRGHGNGMGVALVTGDLQAAATALAEDVVAFDQRGCLSPRVAFVVGDAEHFAKMLSLALEARAKTVPRGGLEAREQQDLAWWESTVGYAGTLLRGESSAVGVLGELVLPPTGRHVLVRPITSVDAFPTELGWATPFTIAVGSDVDSRDVAPAHARRSALGEMQRPPLDGPVDLR